MEYLWLKAACPWSAQEVEPVDWVYFHWQPGESWMNNIFEPGHRYRHRPDYRHPTDCYLIMATCHELGNCKSRTNCRVSCDGGMGCFIYSLQ